MAMASNGTAAVAERFQHTKAAVDASLNLRMSLVHQ